MAQQPSPQQVTRIFEENPAAASFYSDFSQIVGTEHEVYLQFYETIPGAPNAAGQVTQVRTRLRATIMLSRPHAQNLVRSLQQQVAVVPPAVSSPQAPPTTRPQ